MSNPNDFQIANGVLVKYRGIGGVVTVPDGVTTIGERAFSECWGLTSVTIPNSVTSIGEGAFYWCTSLTCVTIPDSVTSIGESAFGWCESLNSITIPNGVTTIGESAFHGCDKLADADGFIIVRGVLHGYCGKGGDVTIPTGVTSIGAKAFSGCKSLISVTIPDSVTSIERSAFTGCSSLTGMTIPDSVTSIGAGAFAWCTSLASVTIPVGITTILQNVFMECTSLTSMTAPGVPFAVMKGYKIPVPATVGYLIHPELYKNPEIIADYRKYMGSQAKKLIPLLVAQDLVQGVAEYAAAGKIKASNVDETFLNPAIAANATQCVAFLLDWKAKNVSPKTIDKQMERELTKDPFNVADMKKLWSYEKLEDGTLEITAYKGKETEIEIPPRIGKQTVTRLAAECFSANKAGRTKERREWMAKLRSVTIPASVFSIRTGAFSGCEHLTIRTVAGSVAEDYAKEHNIPVELVEAI